MPFRPSFREGLEGILISQQIAVFVILAVTFGLFALGRWRYDVVALSALVAVTAMGIVSGEEAFVGFGHPAVVTVAAVLVLSRGVVNSGLIDAGAALVSRVGDRPLLQIVILTAAVAAFSAFMNNVGALALLMPVAIKMARGAGRSPSLYLMPLSFGSLLGGLTTMMGTPPNIIISTFRADTTAGAPFGIFDFAPVGLGVAVAGVLFVSLVGWRLIPERKGRPSAGELFDVDSYLTEVEISANSPAADENLRALEDGIEGDVTVVALIRGSERYSAPSPRRMLREGDVLIVRGSSQDIADLVDVAGLRLVGERDLGDESLGAGDVGVSEAVIRPGSILHGRTAQSLRLRGRYGVNLLAVAREGATLRARLGSIRLREGDVLLLQGPEEVMEEVLADLGCLLLADRQLRLGRPRRVLLAAGIFAASLALGVSGVLPIHLAFTAGGLAMIAVGLLSVREIYDAVDWPVIVLLGAMIPVSGALDSTGGAETIAVGVLQITGDMSPAGGVAALLLITMLLSDLVNNAAAVLLMAPIAVSTAAGMSLSVDAALMAAAVGASCAFLTPIGHQSNTLVLGPGGYRFGDYWRMGLPLQLLILAVALPLILLFWG